MSSDEVALDHTDLAYEEEIVRNRYSVKTWTRYLEHKAQAKPQVRFQIYERAIKEIPGSYKIWFQYLVERRAAVQNFPPNHKTWAEVNRCFERAMVFMHKMPRIWINFLEFLMQQGLITYTRHMFDEALRALPITQHERIWPLYLRFVTKYDIPETAVRVYRRYLMLDPDAAEEYVEYLIKIGRLDEAATKLAEVVNRSNFTSKFGKTSHQLWIELCQLISKYPQDVTSLRVEPIIRGGLQRFTDMIGTLWCSLADFHIRRGNFEKARDVYEEAIATVMTARDFSQVFEAYAEFEESTAAAMMENAGESEEDTLDLELRLARFEHLMERRPLLLSSVFLRQNPHNVDEWQKRALLFTDNPVQTITTYTEAVKTVNPKLAVGRLDLLWVNFAKLYEENGDMDQARQVFDRAVEVPFKTVEELAFVWTEYAEMEMRHKQYKRARHLLQRATTVPGKNQYPAVDGHTPVQTRLHKSLKLWAMYADVEESLGTFESTKAVYTRMVELRVASPQIVINFALFLEEHKYFEEAFSAYEKGIALFRWPVVYEIWNAYLVKFVKRYGGTKLERARELFEQALNGCTDKYCKSLYVLYAQFEEEHGLARHAMDVYERATKKVLPTERYEVWQLYIKRAAQIFGVTYTRELFAKAIEDQLLTDKEIRAMCMQFAELERKLGEIDRARAIYSHASQYCDPRTATQFWDAWHTFEVNHGNEDTFREMRRVKKSVAAQFNTSTNMALFQAAAEAAQAANPMAAMEAKIAEKKQALSAFVKASDAKSAAPAANNADEINIDMDEEEEEEEEAGEDGEGAGKNEDEPDKVEVTSRAVPDAVFGAALGAKERFANARK